MKLRCCPSAVSNVSACSISAPFEVLAWSQTMLQSHTNGNIHQNWSETFLTLGIWLANVTRHHNHHTPKGCSSDGLITIGA